MTIYAIGGVPRAGKTYFRTTCNSLRRLRTVDMDDIYMDAIAGGVYELSTKMAVYRFGQKAWRLLEEDRSSDLVVEAVFLPGGEERRLIEDIAQQFGVGVRWGWAFATRQQCVTRPVCVHGGYPAFPGPHPIHARVEMSSNFILTAEPTLFLAREGESLEALAVLAGGTSVSYW